MPFVTAHSLLQDTAPRLRGLEGAVVRADVQLQGTRVTRGEDDIERFEDRYNRS